MFCKFTAPKIIIRVISYHTRIYRFLMKCSLCTLCCKCCQKDRFFLAENVQPMNDQFHVAYSTCPEPITWLETAKMLQWIRFYSIISTTSGSFCRLLLDWIFWFPSEMMWKRVFGLCLISRRSNIKSIFDDAIYTHTYDVINNKTTKRKCKSNWKIFGHFAKLFV